jgi:hypothetical protein
VPVVFVFVDGVGAGARDPAVNPLARRDHLLSRFADGSGAALPDGGRAALVDATMGVEGRPQSATGQTAILTGENAPRILGHHLVGFPNERLRRVLAERSLFRGLAAAGGRGAFVNAYPVAYLRAIGFEAAGDAEFEFGRRRPRASATTLAFAAGGGRHRTWEDAAAGRALTADIVGRRARAYGARVPLRSPEDAAAVLLEVAAQHDLTMFEFFETDEAGHARSMERALDALDRLDALLRGIVRGLPRGGSLVVASDHGNLEDLSIRNHTRAAVPVLGFGPAAAAVGGIRDLTQLAPTLLALAAPRET